MRVKHVIDERKVEYDVTDQVVGTGGTARVWLGKRKTDGLEVAVKIAYPEATDVEVQLFWDELTILQTLNPHEDKGHVPWARRGNSPEAPRANIIVMEYIPDDWELLRNEKIRDRSEAFVLETGVQCAELLETLHANGISTRGDRKATDIRWGPPGAPRLVVLDYNRAQRFPEGKDANETKSLRAEFVRQDLRDFGRLWGAFALGKSIAAAPPIDGADDAAWNALTRGTRVIFARALGSRSHFGYSAAEELQRALDAHWRRLKFADEGKIEALLQEAEELHDKAKEVDTQIANADQVLSLIDLLQRGDSRALQPFAERIKQLETWASREANEIRLKTASAAQRIQDQIKLESYERAAEIARNTLGDLEGNDLQVRRAKLRLLRWQTIADVGVEGNRSRAGKSGMDMSVVMKYLTEAGQQIDTAAFSAVSASSALNSARAAFDEAKKGITDELTIILKPLECELNVRLASSHNEYATAKMEWEALANIPRARSAAWAENLLGDLTEFDHALAAAMVDTERDERAKRVLETSNVEYKNLLAELRMGE